LNTSTVLLAYKIIPHAFAEHMLKLILPTIVVLLQYIMLTVYFLQNNQHEWHCVA